MKTLITLFFGLTISGFIYSQEYFPLVQENKEWNVLQVSINWNMTDTVYYTYTYKFEGDTMISGINYVYVYKSLEEFPVNWTMHGLITEDQNRKVYFNDLLKYDFGVSLGDTVEIYDNYNPVIAIVQAIDSIFINGDYRKKIILNYLEWGGTEIWIEGIGSTLGVLESGRANYLGGWTWLNCMSQNNELIYMNPNINSCYLISTGIEDKSNSIIEVYPNPVKDKIWISSTENIKIESISIIDLNGIKIKEFKKNKTELDLSGISTGIYLLKLTCENGEIIRKIMVE